MKSPISQRAGGLFLIALTLITLGGCASASRVALNGGEKQISSTQGYVALRKQEIGVDIHGSNISAATGGGLIFALIDSGVENSRAKKAEKLVIPIRDALVGYDIGKTFSESLRTELSAEDWLKNISIEARQLSENNSLNAWLSKISADTMLVLDTDYRMSPDFDGITIRVCASLHPRTPALNAKAVSQDDVPAVLYRNEFSVAAFLLPPTPGTKVTPDDWIKQWTADNGLRARQTLDAGLAELAKMIAFDLKQPGTVDKAVYTAPAGAQTRVANVPFRNGSNVPVGAQGYVVHTEGSKVWIRMPGGQLVSVGK